MLVSCRAFGSIGAMASLVELICDWIVDLDVLSINKCTIFWQRSFRHPFELLAGCSLIKFRTYVKAGFFYAADCLAWSHGPIRPFVQVPTYWIRVLLLICFALSLFIFILIIGIWFILFRMHGQLSRTLAATTSMYNFQLLFCHSVKIGQVLMNFKCFLDFIDSWFLIFFQLLLLFSLHKFANPFLLKDYSFASRYVLPQILQVSFSVLHCARLRPQSNHIDLT